MYSVHIYEYTEMYKYMVSHYNITLYRVTQQFVLE